MAVRREVCAGEGGFRWREVHHEAAVEGGQVGVQVAPEPGVSHDVLCGAALRRVGPEDVVDEVLDLRGELHRNPSCCLSDSYAGPSLECIGCRKPAVTGLH